MAVGDWSEITLATAADVVERYERARELTGVAGGAAQDAAIADKLNFAKSRIGKLLNVRLRPKIAELDLPAEVDILDHIANPEILKDAAVTYALYLLFESASLSDDGYYYSMAANYQKHYREEFDIAFALLQFDENSSGTIEQNEAAAGQSATRFYRV